MCELAPKVEDTETWGIENEEGLSSTLGKYDNETDGANTKDQLDNVPAQQAEAQHEEQAPIGRGKCAR